MFHRIGALRALMIRIDLTTPYDLMDERLKSRGCGQKTDHQETRDPQLPCIFLFADLYYGLGLFSDVLSFVILKKPFGATTSKPVLRSPFT